MKLRRVLAGREVREDAQWMGWGCGIRLAFGTRKLQDAAEKKRVGGIGRLLYVQCMYYVCRFALLAVYADGASRGMARCSVNQVPYEVS